MTLQLPVTISVTSAGDVTITPGASNDVPAAAAALGYTNKIIDINPTVADISPATNGAYPLFDGLYYSTDPVDKSGFTDGPDGLVLAFGRCICSQGRDSTPGTLPYLDASKGFYYEATYKCSDNHPENFPANWLMPMEHNYRWEDIYNLDVPPQTSGYERWTELDVDEGGFVPGQLCSVINWRGDNYAPGGGYSGFVTNSYGDGSGEPFDRTQFHTTGLSWDPRTQTLIWYRDGVEKCRFTGDGTLDSIVPYVTNLQHFYFIINSNSHHDYVNDWAGTNQFTMTVKNIRAFVAPTTPPPPPPPQQTILRRVGYGDSIMYGTGTTNGEGALSWAYKASAWLGAVNENHGVGGEASWNIADRFVADAHLYNGTSDLFVFEGGWNDHTADPAQIPYDVARMVAALPPNARFLVFGVPTGEDVGVYIGGADRTKIDQVNAALASAYGNRFVDINAVLIPQYNPSIPQDVIDHNHGIVPSSLRADLIHPNDAGHEAWFQAEKAKLQSLGWA